MAHELVSSAADLTYDSARLQLRKPRSNALVALGLLHPSGHDEASSPLFHLLAPSADESTVLGSSQYFTAVTSSTCSVDSSSQDDNYITCCETLGASERSRTVDGYGLGERCHEATPVASWMIERLRLYHHEPPVPSAPLSTGRRRIASGTQRGAASEPIAAVTLPSRPSPPRPSRSCFICRVDKLPSPNRHCPAASPPPTPHRSVHCKHTLTDG